jgi:hypothetical protein
MVDGMWISQITSPRLDRRSLLLGLGAVAGCASAPQPLPDYLFSLTVWASGEKIDLLLLNTTEHPLRVINLMPRGLSVRVRDEARAVLTDGPDGYAPLFEALDPARLDARGAGRVRAWKAAKGSIGTRALAQRLSPALTRPLDPARAYDLEFMVEAPVIDADGSVRIARVKSRSLCTARFDTEAMRTDCKSALS